MDEFDVLMQLDSMSDRYRTLTQDGQIDKQLLAFIHYDTLDHTVGLESLDVEELHRQTLAEIDQHDYFEMAFEGFGDSLKSFVEDMKNFITFNKAKPFSHFSSGELVQIKSNITVPDYDDFQKAIVLHSKITKVLAWILENIPKVKSYEEWKKYHSEKFKRGAQFDVMKARDNVAEIRRGMRSLSGNKAMDQSLWTAQKFQKAIHDYDNEVKTMLDQTKKASELLFSLQVLMGLSKYTKKHKNVIASMKRTTYLVNGAFEISKHLQATAKKSLVRVSRHYEPKTSDRG